MQLYFNRTTDLRPTDGEHVVTISPGGTMQNMVYKSGHWFVGEMYVYYTPIYWVSLNEFISIDFNSLKRNA